MSRNNKENTVLDKLNLRQFTNKKTQNMNISMQDYPIFPGIDFIFNEFKGSDFVFEHEPYDNILQINYCLNGRMGWKLHNGDYIYLAENDISLHMADNCDLSQLSFPQEYYRGISIFIDLNEFDKNQTENLTRLNFNPVQLKQKYCNNKQTTVLPAAENIKNLFALLNVIPEEYKKIYFKIKFEELMLYLNILDLSKVKEKDSYPACTIEAVKNVHRKLTDDLKRRPTIEMLSKEFLINTSTLKQVFKTVYGKPIAQYMKDYRMHKAANMLCQSTMTVREIAKILGYENQSKFATAFKEIMQISPTKYRTYYKMKKT